MQATKFELQRALEKGSEFSPLLQSSLNFAEQPYITFLETSSVQASPPNGTLKAGAMKAEKVQSKDTDEGNAGQCVATLFMRHVLDGSKLFCKITQPAGKVQNRPRLGFLKPTKFN